MSLTVGNIPAVLLILGGIAGVIGYGQIGWAFIIAVGALALAGAH